MTAATTKTIWIDGLPYVAKPLLREAASEVLTIIRGEPGIGVSAIAHRRNTTPRAAHVTVMALERRGYITTQVIARHRRPPERACYLKEVADAL